MSYPKASTDEAAQADGAGVPASPRFPEIEERVLRYWAADDTFRASVENRPAGEDGEEAGGRHDEAGAQRIVAEE